MGPSRLHSAVWGAVRVQFEVQAGRTSASALVAAAAAAAAAVAARRPTVCACAGGDVTDVGKKRMTKKTVGNGGGKPVIALSGGVGVATARRSRLVVV